jgi:hypothetical protein
MNRGKKERLRETGGNKREKWSGTGKEGGREEK